MLPGGYHEHRLATGLGQWKYLTRIILAFSKVSIDKNHRFKDY